MSDTHSLLVNLGSGPRSAFREAQPGWREIRVDIDPGCDPDIVASMADLSRHLEDNTADVAFSSHSIEHFADEEVEQVFSEVARILKPSGIFIISCPDLAAVAAALDPEDIEKVLYQSPAGPITALDILYGHRASMAAGNEFMRHRTGFTEKSLADRLLASGFSEVRVQKGHSFDLVAVAAFQAPRDLNIAEMLVGVPGAFH